MKKESMIRYSEKVANTTLLGPGDRAVLWVFGCCFDCPGCIAYNFKHGKYTEETAENLAEWFLGTGKDGITISGGEPMMQAALLSEMVDRIRGRRDIGVVVYTGFYYEELLKRAKEDQGIADFLQQIDILIDGPYMAELNHNEPYRGSSNQRIISLTNRYKDEIEEYYYRSEGRKVEVRISDDKTLMIGVPSRDQAAIWQNIKKLEE